MVRLVWSWLLVIHIATAHGSLDQHDINICALFEIRNSCPCDAACLAYGDCCWDFREACPGMARKFEASPLRHAQAECVGGYNFLVYRPENSASTEDAPPVLANAAPGVTFRAGWFGISGTIIGKLYKKSWEITESAMSGNLPVTDSMTGLTFRSTKDYQLLRKDSTKPDRKIVEWVPKLMFDDPQSIDKLVDLVQNTSHAFKDGAELLFEPKPTDERNVQIRECSKIRIVTCSTVEVKTAHFVEFCQSIATPSSFLHTIPPTSMATTAVFGESQIINDIQNARSDSKFRPQTLMVHSVTTEPALKESNERSTPLPESKTCHIKLFDQPSSRGSSHNFSTGLVVKKPGHFTLLAPPGFPDWLSIECVERRLRETSEMSPCKAKVICGLGRFYLRERQACVPPDIMTLRAAPVFNSDRDEFLFALDRLLNVSKFMGRPDLVLSQDDGSCQSSQTGAAPNFFGMYHILQQKWSQSSERLPVSSLLFRVVQPMRLKNRNESIFISASSVKFFHELSKQLVSFKTIVKQVNPKDRQYYRNVRMNSGRVSVQILYKELVSGRRPSLRYKEVCRFDLKAAGIRPDSWDDIAENRSKIEAWGEKGVNRNCRDS
ncbi:hypothetical protein EGW08_006419 [Elysia chlorotica]|uniref:SMB domain-containing protein n=1 Tax=Elysia chlorotica TaxID=188477 RepID=A0A3S1A935_ELYCH|nr:hypothetical protein EGW08_006419 [Elysia chlorotica]